MLTESEKLELMINLLTREQKDSINKIIKIVEEIWNNNCITSDFTDHGIGHSIRLVGYAYDILLSGNKNNELNQNETYLLLASIYLHDIGMQCYPSEFFSDIIKTGKEILEVKNLSFEDYNIKSESAKESEERTQEFIREYHGVLTKAMLDYSFKNASNVLHEASRSIPDSLRTDLTDLCLFHSKYSIKRCETNLDGAAGRKRLIAAILRLADELDIRSSRINDHYYKFLIKDHKTCIHWLKHKYTSIYIENNIIKMTITLDPEDAEKYGHILQASIMNKFCCKNRKILEILNFSGFDIKLEGENERKEGISTIKRNTSVKKIPDELLSEFKLIERKSQYVSNCRYKYIAVENAQNIKNNIQNNYRPHKILVLGDVMLDTVMSMIDAPYDQVLTHDNLNMVFALLQEDAYLYQTLRIKSSDRRSIGGAGGIVTALLTIPNVHVDTIGVIGNDGEGYVLKSLFDKLQQNTKIYDHVFSHFYPIVINEYPTVTKYYFDCVQYNQGPPLVTRYRFDREDVKLIYENIERYKESFKNELSKTEGTDYECIIIKDHQKGMINRYVIEWLIEKYPNIPIFLDPKYNYDYYKKLNLKAIIPNIKEASMGIREVANISKQDVRKRVTESDLHDDDYKFLKMCLPNCDSFIIKSDVNGAIIYSKDKSSTDKDYFYRDYVYPFPIDASGLKNNIGCGDTFDAYFVISQLKGYSLQTSVKLANIAAAVKRTKEIGEVVSPTEVFNELSTFRKKCIKGRPILYDWDIDTLKC